MNRGRKVNEAVHGVDLLPTICDLAGIELPTDRKLDGVSILPLLTGNTITRKTPLYWSYWAGNPRRPVNGGIGTGGIQAALREGNWKILGRLEPLSPEQTVMEYIRKAQFDAFELYDLSVDQAESTDLAETNPEVLESLKAKLIDLHREVSNEGPSWDLEHFRNKAQR
jgi:arylsulfatase A